VHTLAKSYGWTEKQINETDDLLISHLLIIIDESEKEEARYIERKTNKK
jgi:hypothetical protein